MSYNQNNARIAQNTFLLYIRMLVTMGISLYTSRIVLNTLGVTDYGIYNVVGGVVTMFSFLNSSMSSATQRFLSIEIGLNNIKRLNKIFNTTLLIHLILAAIIFILAESIGLWFLSNHLNIPEDRHNALLWVYHFSVFTFVVSVIQVPFNAIIIANEKMSVFALFSILEATLKLVIAFMLSWLTYDKLKLYSFLVFIVGLIIIATYIIYTKRKIKGSKFSFYWEKGLFKTLINYNGWNLYANFSFVIYTSGVNILLNIFFGPIINAARGIAMQVSSMILSFVANFQMSVNPQIIKSYAVNDIRYMRKLTMTSSKYSYFLLLLISIPLFFEMEQILQLWLGTVPEYTIIFCRLIVINALIDSYSNSITVAVQATGIIKKFQIIVGSIYMLNIGLSYIFFKLGFSPTSTFITSIIISILLLFVRLLILSKLMRFSMLFYYKEVLIKTLYVTTLSLIFPILIYYNFQLSKIRMISILTCSIIFTLCFIFLVGLDKSEREFMFKKLSSLLIKINIK